MKNLFILINLFLFIFKINTKISDEKRNALLKKITQKINSDISIEIKSKYYGQKHLKDTIKYDPEKIESIMKKYNYPQNYSFFETTGATIHVKDQAKCGCCWSHAATSALAYRYHKFGIDIDLSPQHALSCYIKDCSIGNYLIDSQLNLVKNGTVTEECLPFSSGNGTIIDDCPTSCKDGSELKKYYSQNAYMTKDYYSKETFYEIVTLILDQLYNYGPVVSSIDVYNDFIELHSDPERCHKEVYTYDEKSLYLGGHAVTIVGYGYMNSKYYWLIQNSWGESACDKGFVKVEFGQIGVESVAFAEPNVKKDWEEPISIPIEFKYIDGSCNMNIISTELTHWVNTLDIKFKNKESNKPFYFQCGLVSLLNENKKVCYYEHQNYYNDKGIYKYESFESLGNDNYFITDSSFNEIEFNYYGIDAYDYIFSNILYVSQEGSKIFFFYSNFGGDDRFISPIYPNINSTYYLSNCHNVSFVDFDFVYCDIKQNEVDYFYDMNDSNATSLVYNVLCGHMEEVSVIVYKLDISKYPVFKIKKFIAPQEKILTAQSKIIGVADIEGSITGYYSIQSIFYLYAYVEIQNHNYTSLIECQINKPRRIMKNFFLIVIL